MLQARWIAGPLWGIRASLVQARKRKSMKTKGVRDYGMDVRFMLGTRPNLVGFVAPRRGMPVPSVTMNMLSTGVRGAGAEHN